MNYPETDLEKEYTQVFSGRRVLVTGHTGFKGSWLSEWLLACGAEVSGFALEPVTKPSLFEQLGLASRMDHTIADIRNPESIRETVQRVCPDFVFHLAAQPLVMASYDEPLATFATNVLGTANLLEALRGLNQSCIGLMVTTDKCYRNDNSGRPFKESDALGGDDPYSASKAAMEILVHSYRKSFFRKAPVRLATARAGNVIGGGDYAADRIVPDCIRSLKHGDSVTVRNPGHTRPFQHVLEPLSGYLWLAARLSEGFVDPEDLYAFNFGPDEEGHRSVSELVEQVLSVWPGKWEAPEESAGPSESAKLALSIDRATEYLGWRPRWGFQRTVEETVNWYREANEFSHSGSAEFIELTRHTFKKFSESNA